MANLRAPSTREPVTTHPSAVNLRILRSGSGPEQLSPLVQNPQTVQQDLGHGPCLDFIPSDSASWPVPALALLHEWNGVLGREQALSRLSCLCRIPRLTLRRSTCCHARTSMRCHTISHCCHSPVMLLQQNCLCMSLSSEGQPCLHPRLNRVHRGVLKGTQYTKRCTKAYLEPEPLPVQELQQGPVDCPPALGCAW